jgi:parallel beta-helix repeat protein
MKKLKYLNKTKIGKDKVTMQNIQKKVLTFLTIALLVIASFYAGYTIASSSNTFTISSGVYPGAVSYTVWRDGDYYYAKNAYGAIEFSGTDASTVIQSAINALTNGGKIFIKAGIYFDNTWNVQITNNNIEVVAEKGTIFKPTAGATVYQFILVKADNVVIDGIEIDGSGATAYNGVYLYADANRTNFKIRDVKISNLASYGIYAYSAAGVTTKKVTIENAVLIGNKRGVTLEAVDTPITDVTINGVLVENSSDSGILLWKAKNVNINNVITNSNAVHGLALIRTTNFDIENVIALDNGHIGVVISELSRMGNLVNIVAGNNRDHGISIDVTSSGTPQDAFITLANCVGFGSTLYHGLYIEGSNYIIVTEFIGLNNTDTGILIGNSDYVTVINSLLKGNKWGIYVSNAADYATVKNNDLRGNTIGALYNGGATGVVIKGNAGYVTENSGTATIPSGQTSVTVNHGLAGTPTLIIVTGTTSDTADAYVSAKTSTTFTITVPSPVSGNRIVYWYAKYEP